MEQVDIKNIHDKPVRAEEILDADGTHSLTSIGFQLRRDTTNRGLLPSKGGLRYEGHDLYALSTEERVRRGICLVPERRELFTEMTVEDNLILGAYTRWNDRDAVRSDLGDVYARFPRLNERKKQLAGTLSGGERQMLALGRALMAKPRLLLLDEPSLGLAPLIVRDILRIVASLRDTGVSILLVEQNAKAALEIADYGYVLETGEIVLDGDAKNLLGDARVQADEPHALGPCAGFIDRLAVIDGRDELIARHARELVVLHGDALDHEAPEGGIVPAELHRREPRTLGDALKPRPLRLRRNR